MIAHATLAVSDYEKSKGFYQKILAPLGYEFTDDHPEWMAGGYKEGGNTSFWIGQKENVQGGHVAFEAKTKEAVDEFYKIALAEGGKDNGAPGYRTEYWPGYYAAFVHDADGNNVEAVWFDYSKVEATS
jgi:catechol 2,3-dioxygenase-like lactoylglutathione lyase family enzyme